MSPYGAIMDIYEAQCGDASSAVIFMDMYHPGYIEQTPVSGFTMERPNGT